MRVRLLSDVHLEEGNAGWIPPKHWKLSDLGILAGDIGNPYNPDYKNLLIHNSQKHRVSVLVPGNHEYYVEGKNMDSVKEKLKEVCRDTNTILLDGNTYDLDNNIRLVGATMWPTIPPEYYPYLKKRKHGLVTKITSNMFPLTVEEIERMSATDLNFLKRILMQTEDTIVVTHYPPSSIMLSDSTEHLPEVTTHWTEAMNLMKSNIKLWACGHGHTSKKFLVNPSNIPLVSNCVAGGQFDEDFEIIVNA